jgi:hypothetical protein
MTEKKGQHRSRSGAAAAILAAAALASIVDAAALPSAAFAQGSADAQLLASSRVAPTNLPTLVPTSDIFAGKNAPGPYELTWKKLVQSREYVTVVQVDGKRLPEAAYSLDLEKGVLTFKEPLKQASMARIDYAYSPGLSERNQNPAAAPVTLPVLKAGATSLQLTALPKVGGAAASSKSAALDTLLVWGLNNRMSLLGGGLTSQVYLSPDMKDSKGEDGFMDRTGLSLGYKTGNQKNGFDAGFLRTGRDFAPTAGKSFGMGESALQQLSLAARYAFTGWFNADWSQVETRSLTGAGGSSDLSKWNVRLGGIGNTPALGYSRVEDTKTNAKGVGADVVTDQLNLSAKLGTRTSVSGVAKQVATNNDGDKGDVTLQETSVALNTASKDKSQSAAVAVNTLTKESFGALEEKQSIAVTVKASHSVTFTAEQKQESVTPFGKSDEGGERELNSEKAKESSQQAARAEIALAPGAKITTGVRTNEVGEDKTSVTEMSAQIGAIKNVDLQGSFINRSASNDDGPSTLNTTSTRVAFKPSPTLTVTGALTINPEDKGKITEAKRQEFGLQAKFGDLKLGSAYTVTALTTEEAQAGEFSLSLGFRLNRFTNMTGTYKDALLWGADEESKLPRGVRIYSFGLNHTIGSTLNFAVGGSVTQNKQDVEAPDDIKAEAKLGVKF